MRAKRRLSMICAAGPASWRVLAPAARLWRSTGGMSSVEMAFIAPLLVLLVIGLVDYGAVINRKMQLANAVRAGAQYALVRKPVQDDTTQIENAVLNTAPPDGAGTQEVDARVFCECADGTEIVCSNVCADGSDRAAYVEVWIQEDFETIFSYPVFSNPIRLRNEATVRLN